MIVDAPRGSDFLVAGTVTLEALTTAAIELRTTRRAP
jgi:hypothetical protein